MIGIIGASGFIGKNLTSRLPKTVGISLRDDNWKNQISDKTVILNLVGKAHDHKGLATEGDYYYVNVELTKEIFRCFITSSKTHLMIHISSIAAIEEYEAKEPLTEIDECKPVSWYGKSKRKAEEWLMEQELPSGKKLVILRPPMVHGSGDKGNLGLLYRLISKGIPYPLSSFNNRRSFISIDNFSFYIAQIIETQNIFRSGIYHIADDEPISTKEIIDIIKSITGRQVPNIAVPKFFIEWIAKLGNVIPIPLNPRRLRKMTSDLVVSTSKIKNELNVFQTPLTARQGFEKTIKSFR